MLGSRRIRWIAAVAVCTATALIISYNYFITSKRTAEHLSIWAQGDAAHVHVDVNVATGYSVFDAQGIMSRFYVVDGALVVPVDSLGLGFGKSVGGASWIEVPLSALDSRFGALGGRRVLDSLSRSEVECERPGPDAIAVLRLLLRDRRYFDHEFTLCGAGVGAVAKAGRDILVRREAVRPEDLEAPPKEGVVKLEDVADQVSVLNAINAL